MCASWLAVMFRLLPGRRPIKNLAVSARPKPQMDFGGLAIFPHGVHAGKTHSFASPPHDGFAFVEDEVFVLSISVAAV